MGVQAQTLNHNASGHIQANIIKFRTKTFVHTSEHETKCGKDFTSRHDIYHTR